MLNEIFSRLDVAGKTAIGMVTNPKLIEPFQIDLMIFTDLPRLHWRQIVNNFSQLRNSSPLLRGGKRYDVGRQGRDSLSGFSRYSIGSGAPAVLLDQTADKGALPGQIRLLRSSGVSAFHSVAKTHGAQDTRSSKN
jgi:hypothetical protein